MENLVDKAKEYATREHARVNHMYDDNPYTYHLQMVVDIIEEFWHTIRIHTVYMYDPNNGFKNLVKSVAWLHDVMEEPYKSYNDIKTAFNDDIANLVYVLSPYKGRNRQERYPSQYYQEVKMQEATMIVKIADRIANIRHGKSHTGSRMFAKYQKEHEHFKKMLYDEKYVRMFMELDKLIYE